MAAVNTEVKRLKNLASEIANEKVELSNKFFLDDDRYLPTYQMLEAKNDTIFTKWRESDITIEEESFEKTLPDTNHVS